MGSAPAVFEFQSGAPPQNPQVDPGRDTKDNNQERSG